MPPAEDEFDDDEFDDLDEIAIQELDALESELNGVKPSALPSASTGLHQRAANPKATPPRLIPTPVGHSRLQNGANASVLPGIEATSEDLFDDSWDEVMLNDIDQLDSMYNDARTAEPAPPRNRTFRRSTSGSFKQRNLFGDIIPDGPERRAPAQSPGSLSLSSQNQSGASSGARRHSTKQWDRTAYAKSGHRSMKGKERARHASTRDEYGAAIGSEEEAEAEDAGEPEGEVNINLPPPLPMKNKIDEEAAQTWVYPTNKSMRDYQYNIVQKSLFNNVLVALPTGLGKTFIAAVVILNYYRWFPEGKIIFVAPTKPLVSQQIEACHEICGLPADTAIELTGSTKSRLRGDEWQTKRIFYMTPQTFENDLTSTNCDPRDVVCLVVDEAHRATGAYAYGNVVRHLMKFNPHFRVLALTATPGSTSEKVQEVIDNLHISVIEIRTEDALDIRQYVHKKHEEAIKVSLGPQVGRIRDKWAQLMRVYLDPLVKENVLREQDPSILHPFTCRSALSDRKTAEILRRKPWLRNSISQLASMAQAMQYLIEESVSIFHDRIMDMASGGKSNGSKASSTKSQIFSESNATWREILAIFKNLQGADGQFVHPKMKKLGEVVEHHFSRSAIAAIEDEEAHWVSGKGVDGEPPRSQHETRVMVFCSLREGVNEIVNYLNSGGFKATPFIGQASDTKGNRGFTQKQQEEVIKQFKAGHYNVLVATSIGEEGLDIGEVDLIVCYEAVKDSVRMLQRVGRTGRKRDGNIVVLMSEGREEANWKHAKDSYKAVQRGINSGYQVELYDDVSRMVPTWIHPRCEKREVDAFPFERELLSRRRSSGKSSTKVPKKRNSDPKRNAPEGALLGFLKASEIALGSKKAGGKGKQKESENKEGEDEMSDEDTKAKRNKLFFSDDSDDAKLEEGLTFSPLLQSRRSNSNLKLPSRSSHGSDSSGVGTIAKAKPTPSKQSRGRRLGLSRATASSVKRVLDGNSSDTLSDEDPAGPSKYASEFMFPEPPASARASRPATRRVSSPTSPIQPRGRRTDDAELGMSWNFTSDVEDELEAAKSGSRPLRGTTGLHRHSSPARAEPIQIDSSPILHIRRPPHPLIAELVALENLHSSDGDEDDQEDKKAEAEAEAEVHGAEQQEETGNAWSQGSITNESPIVAPQRRARLTRVARRIQTSSSPIPPAREETGLMAPPRMMAARAGGSRAVATKASAKGTKRKKKRIGNSPNSKFLFRWEAERDTDEERHGERDEDDEGLSTDQEDDDDRAAVGMFEPTQAPKGYHQQIIYAQSLLSQVAPSPFKRRRVGAELMRTPPGGGQRRGPGAIPSSEPRPSLDGGEEEDRYSCDSFCVDDEEEVEFEESSQANGSQL